MSLNREQKQEQKSMANSQEKFLMFDHGGVLDDLVADNLITENDLVLGKSGFEGVSRVVKDGVSVVNMLRMLVNDHGYKIVFHSKNSEEDQMDVLTKLRAAWVARGKKEIDFPVVHAMAVYDNKRREEFSNNNEIMSKVGEIQIAGYAGDDAKGKASLRAALSKRLKIEEKDRAQHIVFDDGDTIIDKAREEGYQAFLIGTKQGPQCERVSLHSAITTVLERHRPKNEMKEEKVAAVPSPLLPLLLDLLESYMKKEKKLFGNFPLNNERTKLLGKSIENIANNQGDAHEIIVNLLVCNILAVKNLARMNTKDFGEIHRNILANFPDLVGRIVNDYNAKHGESASITKDEVTKGVDFRLGKSGRV